MRICHIHPTHTHVKLSKEQKEIECVNNIFQQGVAEMPVISALRMAEVKE